MDEASSGHRGRVCSFLHKRHEMGCGVTLDGWLDETDGNTEEKGKTSTKTCCRAAMGCLVGMQTAVGVELP